MVGEMLAEKMRLGEAYALAKREALTFQPIRFAADYLKRDEIYVDRLDRLR